MTQAIILGDVHLGHSLNIGKATVGSNLNSKIVDQLNLLDWTLDQALDNNTSNIIITGDIFEDPKPHPSIITLFISWLKKCQANGVKVHLIAGNHDILRSGYVYSSPLDIISEVELENVFVYKDINTIFINSTAFTFIPFRDRKSLGKLVNSESLSLLQDIINYELASIPITYKKILVGHLAIEGSIPVGDEIDDMNNELFCPISMFNGYDYVWMGHVHKPQIMNKKNPYVAHIGSMDVSNFGESDHKKILILVDCNSPDEDFKTIKIPTRNLKKISIIVPKDTEDSTQYVLDQIKSNNKNLEKSIVRLEVSLSSQDLKSVNKSVLEKYLTENGVFNVAGISESKKTNVIKKESSNNIDTNMDVASAIKTYASAYIDDSLKEKFIEISMDIYTQFKTEIKQ